MPNPNSKLTLIRRAIVKIVEPLPSEGEAWCLDCSLNNGKTIVYLCESVANHVRSHPHGIKVKVLVTARKGK